MLTTRTIKELNIISEEGLRLKAYKDTGGVLTIGFGHTSDNFFEVKSDSVITEDFAYELYRNDLYEAERTMARELGEAIKTLNENQYAAIVSIIYNAGTLKVRRNGEWSKSVLMHFLGIGLWKEAESEIRKFKLNDRKGNPVLKGRRNREADLFGRPVIDKENNAKLISQSEAIQPKGLDKIEST